MSSFTVSTSIVRITTVGGTVEDVYYVDVTLPVIVTTATSTQTQTVTASTSSPILLVLLRPAFRLSLVLHRLLLAAALPLLLCLVVFLLTLALHRLLQGLGHLQLV